MDKKYKSKVNSEIKIKTSNLIKELENWIEENIKLLRKEEEKIKK